MDLKEVFSNKSTRARLRVQSKKQLLQAVSELAAEQTGLPAGEILAAVTRREHLGSTGIGNGIAVPHGKIAALPRLTGFLAALRRPIPYDAPDEQPVDLAFLLLGPESAAADYLKVLGRITRLRADTEWTTRLRACKDAPALFAQLTGAPAPHAATAITATHS